MGSVRPLRDRGGEKLAAMLGRCKRASGAMKHILALACEGRTKKDPQQSP